MGIRSRDQIEQWLLTCHIPDTSQAAGIDKSHLYRIRAGQRPIIARVQIRLSMAIDYLETLPKRPRNRMKLGSVRSKKSFRRLMRLKEVHNILFAKVPYIPHDRKAILAVERKCKRRILKLWPDYQYLYWDRKSSWQWYQIVQKKAKEKADSLRRWEKL